jgi:hypothetical protein
MVRICAEAQIERMRSMKSLRVLSLALLLSSVCLSCANPGATTSREMTADSDGLALYVRVAGAPAAGNVLVAIHGGPGMTSDYMLSLEQLAGPEQFFAAMQAFLGRAATAQ